MSLLHDLEASYIVFQKELYIILIFKKIEQEENYFV